MSEPAALTAACQRMSQLRVLAGDPAAVDATAADHRKVLACLQAMFPDLVTAGQMCRPSGTAGPALATAAAAVADAAASLDNHIRVLAGKGSLEAKLSEAGKGLVRAAQAASASVRDAQFTAGNIGDHLEFIAGFRSLVLLTAGVLLIEARQITASCCCGYTLRAAEMLCEAGQACKRAIASLADADTGGGVVNIVSGGASVALQAGNVTVHGGIRLG